MTRLFIQVTHNKSLNRRIELWNLSTPLFAKSILLTDSFPMHPHAPGNWTPLKFHCTLMRPVSQGSISLAVTRKLNSPEYCKAPNRDMHKFSFHLRPNSTDSVEFSIFPEFFNFTFLAKIASGRSRKMPDASD